MNGTHNCNCRQLLGYNSLEICQGVKYEKSCWIAITSLEGLHDVCIFLKYPVRFFLSIQYFKRVLVSDEEQLEIFYVEVVGAEKTIWFCSGSGKP